MAVACKSKNFAPSLSDIVPIAEFSSSPCRCCRLRPLRWFIVNVSMAFNYRNDRTNRKSAGTIYRCINMEINHKKVRQHGTMYKTRGHWAINRLTSTIKSSLIYIFDNEPIDKEVWDWFWWILIDSKSYQNIDYRWINIVT